MTSTFCKQTKITFSASESLDTISPYSSTVGHLLSAFAKPDAN